MDRDVHRVVAEDLVLAEPIVETECDVGDRSLVVGDDDGVVESFEVDLIPANGGLVHDGEVVVEGEWGLENALVEAETGGTEDHHHEDGELPRLVGAIRQRWRSCAEESILRSRIYCPAKGRPSVFDLFMATS